MAEATLYVCTSCRDLSAPDAPRPGAQLVERLRAAGLPLRVEAVECLAVCERPVTVAFNGPGRWTYLFGDIDAATLDDLIAYATAYGASETGLVPLRQRPAAIRQRTIARVPPLGFSIGDKP